MLVLTRDPGEAILIGEPPNCVRLIFLESRGKSMRVGIVAPREIPVHRAELAAEIWPEHFGTEAKA